MSPSPDAVRIPPRCRRRRGRNGVNLPRRMRIARPRHEPHPPLGPVEVLGIGRERRQQVELAVAIDIDELRALVVRHRRQHVLLPRRPRLLRVLQPPRHRARPIDHDQIRPAIAVQVIRKRLKRMAVAQRVILRRFLPRHLHLPFHPSPSGSGRVRVLIPNHSRRNILLAILVEIPHRHPLAPKHRIQHRLLKRNAPRRARLCPGWHRQHANPSRHKNQPHAITS